MTPDERDRLVRLETRAAALETAVNETRADVKQILAYMNQGRGGWKTIAMISGSSGVIGALLAKIGITVGGAG